MSTHSQTEPRYVEPTIRAEPIYYKLATSLVIYDHNVSLILFFFILLICYK